MLPAYIGIGGYTPERYIVEVYYKGLRVNARTRDDLKSEEEVLDYIEEILQLGEGYTYRVFLLEQVSIEIEDSDGNIRTNEV